MLLQKLNKPIKFLNIEIHISAIVLVLVGMYLDFMHNLLTAYCITALHEFAHIITARRVGVKIKGVEVLPFGVTMRLGEAGIRKTTDEIKIAMAGPLCNFLISYLVYGFYAGAGRDFIILSSMTIGLFNILPALPLDGGRIFRAVLVMKYGCIKGTGIAIKMSKAFALIIALTGVYILYITEFNFSLLLIGAFLIANITEERKSHNMIIMKDIIYSRKKLEDSIDQAGILVVTDTESAKTVLKKLTYDRYYMIDIVDSQARLLYTVSETCFIEGVATLGLNAPMKNFVGL